MASYGIRVTNPDGELVLHSECMLLSYLGRATRTGTTQPTTTTGGFSTYTFVYAGAIVPALKLSTTRAGTVYSLTQAGSTWTIRVSWWDTTAPLTAELFGQQASDAEVFVYGFPLTSASNYGIRLRDPSGAISGDLTRPPLIVKERRTFPFGSGTVGLSGAASVPAILGRTDDLRVVASPVGSGSLSDFNFSAATFRLSGGSLVRSFDLRAIQRAATDAFDVTTRQAARDVWIVDVGGL